MRGHAIRYRHKLYTHKDQSASADQTENPVRRFWCGGPGELPDAAGVYALCDLDNVPIYVGQATASKDTSIRKRVQRHLTSARSDVIANRQLDVWEIAYVRGWVCENEQARKILESQLVEYFDGQSPLVNGTIPTRLGDPIDLVPDSICVQVMADDLITTRKDPGVRFPRQAQTFTQLLDYVLNVYDKPH